MTFTNHRSSAGRRARAHGTTGIRVDPAQLKVLCRPSSKPTIQRLSAEIYELAGKPFNINSPQQLGKVLFEDLNLPAPVKYGKGKAISTAADVLEDLAAEHEIARKVLEYRQLSKLKGTYVDALPRLIDPATRPPAHHASIKPALPPDGCRRPIRTCRTFPSEPSWAAKFAPPLFRSAGWKLSRRRLFADRAAPAGAHVARSGAGRRLPQRRGHSHPHRRRSLRRSAA